MANQPMKTNSFEILNQNILNCSACPRLLTWISQVADQKVARHSSEDYWGKPVPGFGDENANILIVGLAPAAHGANRTGRMFTGDRSGEWLYRALFQNGFANQYSYTSAQDGLQLNNVYITAICHCAPPENKPTPLEIKNCQPHLFQTFENLHFPPVVIALGKLAFEETCKILVEKWGNPFSEKPKFLHGAFYTWSKTTLIASYHPSQQNTFTKLLTDPMFDDIFKRAKLLLS